MINWRKLFGIGKSDENNSNNENDLRNTPLIELIKNQFSFLEQEFGFEFVDKGFIRERQIVAYKSEFAQIELASSYEWFHALGRRIVNGVLANYNDKENCIQFEELAILDSLENYDHLDYYVSSINKLEKVMNTTSNLFRNNIEYFNTNNWIDYTHLKKLKNEEFYRNHKFYPKNDVKLFIDVVDEKLTAMLNELNYVKTRKSTELPPYDSRNIFEHILYKKDEKLIMIKQVDWRDERYKYQLKIEDKVIYEFKVSHKEEQREKKILELFEKITSKE